jgi:pimeloyl-ACP methyl ester carboxylesterase
VPILLIHGLADNNIPFQQSEEIRNHNPADIRLWEVPRAGHCGAVDADLHIEAKQSQSVQVEMIPVLGLHYN